MKFSHDELQFFYQYCVALIRDEALAYDLLQATLEKWFRHGEHRQVTHPRAYFMRMIKSQFIDDLRKEGRWIAEPFEESQQVPEIGSDALDEIVISRDQLERIFRVLSAEDREILFLWAVQGYTTQEIADFLDIPKGTILARLFRLRKRLKKDSAEGEKMGKL